MDDPLPDFPDATPEQKTIVMLMNRVGAIEAELHDTRARLERAERAVLATSGIQFNVGRRALWDIRCTAGLHPVPGRSFAAITDLASDVIGRAMRRERGPLFEHLNKPADCPPGQALPPTLTGYVEASGLKSASFVHFKTSPDAGLLVVRVEGPHSMLDVMAELNCLLEDEDASDGSVYTRHEITFVPISMVVFNFLDTATDVPPGGIEAAADGYVAAHPELSEADRSSLESVFWRTNSVRANGGSTLVPVGGKRFRN